MKTIIYNFIIISYLTKVATLTTHAQAGYLDLPFGNGGIVTTDFGSMADYCFSVAMQSDGKIVAAGHSFNGFDFDVALVRYNNDGSLDNSFGSLGMVNTAIASDDDYGASVAIQSDGKIVVAGSANFGSAGGFALVRYNSNGSLDNNFGSGGIVTTAFGNYGASGNSVTIQSDGKIVVAGTSNNGSDDDFALARYNSDGNLDTSFGSLGMVTTAIGSDDDYGASVDIQSDGKIVVAGTGNGTGNYGLGEFAIVRYNSNGSLDNNFGTGGIVTTAIGSFGDYGRSVAIQSDGKIVVAGSKGENYGNPGDFALVRYTGNGSLDNSFGSGGIVTTAIGSFGGWGGSVAINSNGKIVVAGTGDPGNPGFFALVQYNSDGSQDNSFGYGGIVTTAVGNVDSYGNSVVIQNDGKIVVAGLSYIGSGYDFVVARYYGDNAVAIAENITEGNIFSVSPNPFTKEITLHNDGNGEVVIFDMMGKEILRQKTFGTETIINTSQLASGLYLLHYMEGNKTENIKVVKF